MANENWWEAAPLVEETVAESENWWEAAPLLEEEAADYKHTFTMYPDKGNVIDTPPLPEAPATGSIKISPKDIVPISMVVNKLSGIPVSPDESNAELAQLWESSEGNVEDFVSQLTGDPDRSGYGFQDYVAEIKNNLRSNEPGGINSNISNEIYSKYPFLPKVSIHGTTGYVNPYGVGTALEYFSDDDGGRVEFDLDKATETDVILDILHAIPDGKDLMLKQKYEKFASKIAEDRADDIKFFYQEALRNDPDIPEDEFVNNYIDSQLRAVLATTMGGSSDPNYKIDYADIEKLSPDSIQNGEDILQYIKGYGSDRAEVVGDIMEEGIDTADTSATPLSTAYRQQGIEIEKPEEVMKMVARSRIDSGNFATHDLKTNAASLAEAYHDPNAKWEETLKNLVPGDVLKVGWTNIRIESYEHIQDLYEGYLRQTLTNQLLEENKGTPELLAEFNNSPVLSVMHKTLYDFANTWSMGGAKRYINKPTLTQIIENRISEIPWEDETNPHMTAARILTGTGEVVEHLAPLMLLGSMASSLGASSEVSGAIAFGGTGGARRILDPDLAEHMTMGKWIVGTGLDAALGAVFPVLGRLGGEVIREPSTVKAVSKYLVQSGAMASAITATQFTESLYGFMKDNPSISFGDALVSVGEGVLNPTALSHSFAMMLGFHFAGAYTRFMPGHNNWKEAAKVGGKTEFNKEWFAKLSGKEKAKVLDIQFEQAKHLAEGFLDHNPKTGRYEPVKPPKTVQEAQNIIRRQMEWIDKGARGEKIPWMEQEPEAPTVKAKAITEGKPEVKPEVKVEVKPKAVKEPEVKPEVVIESEIAKEPEVEVKPEIKAGEVEAAEIEAEPREVGELTDNSITELIDAHNQGIEGKINYYTSNLKTDIERYGEPVKDMVRDSALPEDVKAELIGKEVATTETKSKQTATDLPNKIAADILVDLKKFIKHGNKESDVTGLVSKDLEMKFAKRVAPLIESNPELYNELVGKKDAILKEAERIAKEDIKKQFEGLSKKEIVDFGESQGIDMDEFKPIEVEPPAPPSTKDFNIDNPENTLPDPKSFEVADPVQIPIKSINVDPDRFQPPERAGTLGYEADRVNAMVEDFQPELIARNPITVWKDPVDDKYYVLAGHHRYQAVTQKGGYDSMPVYEFKGTEAEAITHAYTENAQSKGMDDVDTAHAVGMLHKQGKTPKEILAAMPSISNIEAVRKYVALSYLNPKGNFMQNYTNTSLIGIKGRAQKVSQYRKKWPEFKDSHEDAIFDYVYVHGMWKRNKIDDYIDSIIYLNVFFDQFDGKPLRLKDPIGRSAAELEYDERVEVLNKEISKMQSDRNKLDRRAAEEGIDVKALTKAKSKLDEEIAAAYQELNKMVIGRDGAISQIRQQGSLFGSPRSSPHSTVVSIDQIKADKLINTRDYKVRNEIKKIYKHYGIPIAEKGLPKRLLGYYTNRGKRVRVQSTYDILTAIHELTHALDKRHGVVNDLMGTTGYTTDGKPIYNPATKQIRKLLTEQYLRWYPGAKKSHPLELRLSEGLAVTTEHYLMDRELMLADYPEVITEVFSKNGIANHPDFNKMYDMMYEVIQNYHALDPLDKVGNQMLSFKDNLKPKDDKSFSIGQRITFEIANMYEPAERWAKITGTKGIQNPYTWSTALQHVPTYISNAIYGSQMVVISPDGRMKIVDVSLKLLNDKFEGQSGDLEDFNKILLARRYVGDYNKMVEYKKAVEVAKEELKDLLKIKAEMEAEIEVAEGEEVFQADVVIMSINGDIAQAKKELLELTREFQKIDGIVKGDNAPIKESAQILDEYSDNFKEELDIFDKINDTVLEIYHQAGVLHPSKYKELKKQNAKGYYAPMFRIVYDEILNNDMHPLNSGLGTEISQGNQFKARKGSSLAIIPPTVAVARNIASAYHAAVQNIFWSKLLDMSINHDELAVRLEKNEYPATKWHPVEVDERGIVSGGYLEDLELAKTYRDPNYIRVFRSGKPTYWKISNEFALMAEAMGNSNIHILNKVITGGSRLFTRLTTSANPVFAAGNYTIDQFTAILQSEPGYTPIKDPIKLLMNYFGNMQAMTESEISALDRYLKTGGERATLASFLRTSEENIETILSKRESKPVKVFESGMRLLEMPSNFTEILTRATEYMNSLNAGKSEMEAMHNANQVTVPFSQMGAWLGDSTVRAWVKGIAFLNPAIQATYKYGKTFGKKGIKWGVAVHAGFMTAAISSFIGILSQLNEDERNEYINQLANMPVSELSRAMWFPTPGGRGLVRIRIPEALGAATGLVYMAIVNWHTDHDFSAEEFADMMTEWSPDLFNFTDPGKAMWSAVPQIAKPSLEAWTNTRTYPEVAPIVPQYLKDKPARMQYTDYTSEVAKSIGRVLGWSPAKIEHWVRNQFGAVGGAGLGKLQANPLFRQMDEYVTRGRIVNKFYQTKDQISEQEAQIEEGRLTDLTELFNLTFHKKTHAKMSELMKAVRTKYSEENADISVYDKYIKGKEVLDPKTRAEFIDLIADVTHIQDRHYGGNIKVNAKKSAELMLRMQLIAKKIDKQHLFTIDDDFIEKAYRGSLKKQDIKNTAMKLLKSVVIKNRVDNGEDRDEANKAYKDQLAQIMYMLKK